MAGLAGEKFSSASDTLSPMQLYSAYIVRFLLASGSISFDLGPHICATVALLRDFTFVFDARFFCDFDTDFLRMIQKTIMFVGEDGLMQSRGAFVSSLLQLTQFACAIGTSNPALDQFE